MQSEITFDAQVKIIRLNVKVHPSHQLLVWNDYLVISAKCKFVSKGNYIHAQCIYG